MSKTRTEQQVADLERSALLAEQRGKTAEALPPATAATYTPVNFWLLAAVCLGDIANFFAMFFLTERDYLYGGAKLLWQPYRQNLHDPQVNLQRMAYFGFAAGWIISGIRALFTSNYHTTGTYEPGHHRRWFNALQFSLPAAIMSPFFGMMFGLVDIPTYSFYGYAIVCFYVLMEYSRRKSYKGVGKGQRRAGGGDWVLFALSALGFVVMAVTLCMLVGTAYHTGSFVVPLGVVASVAIWHAYQLIQLALTLVQMLAPHRPFYEENYTRLMIVLNWMVPTAVVWTLFATSSREFKITE